MLFILALAVAIVGGALAHRAAVESALGPIARVAAAVAGAVLGYILVYVVASNV